MFSMSSALTKLHLVCHIVRIFKTTATCNRYFFVPRSMSFVSLLLLALSVSCPVRFRFVKQKAQREREREIIVIWYDIFSLLYIDILTFRSCTEWPTTKTEMMLQTGTISIVCKSFAYTFQEPQNISMKAKPPKNDDFEAPHQCNHGYD